jgi:hypothetical protein
MGFSSSWRDCISKLLRSASTKILLNGAPGQRICHARGLWQGDPLSPLHFILVMETLNALLRKADDCYLLQPVATRQIKHRVSLYADDLIRFIAPVAFDLSLANEIFQLLGEASGLRSNYNKCQIAPIRCSEEQISLVTQLFPCAVADFPICYLGISVSTTSLPKSAWHSLIERAADKMPVWKGNLMHKSGRLRLIKSTLSDMPMHSAISLELPAWVRKALIKLMRGFLWTGTEDAHGGKCLVAWNQDQHPLRPWNSKVRAHGQGTTA